MSSTEIEELRAQLRESQQREAQWKKIAEEAQRREQATARSLYRWQHNEMIEGDYIDENGDVVGDPYLERDRAITQYLEAQYRAEQGALPVNEDDERIVDDLVAERQAELKTKPIHVCCADDCCTPEERRAWRKLDSTRK